MTQQVRNVSWQLGDEGTKLSVVIHDRDRKFAPAADRVSQSEGARVILTPLMAPRANAHAERCIGSCRRECLDWMLILNSDTWKQSCVTIVRTATLGVRIGA